MRSTGLKALRKYVQKIYDQQIYNGGKINNEHSRGQLGISVASESAK